MRDLAPHLPLAFVFNPLPPPWHVYGAATHALLLNFAHTFIVTYYHRFRPMTGQHAAKKRPQNGQTL